MSDRFSAHPNHFNVAVCGLAVNPLTRKKLSQGKSVAVMLRFIRAGFRYIDIAGLLCTELG